MKEKLKNVMERIKKSFLNAKGFNVLLVCFEKVWKLKTKKIVIDLLETEEAGD